MLNKLTFSRTTLVILIIALMWMIQDINTRFILDNSNQVAKNVTSINNDLSLPIVSENMLQKIKTVYLTFKDSEPSEEKLVKQGMSEQEQLKQTGELTNVFIGNYKLSLKAVLTKGSELTNQKVALVQVTKIDTNEISIETFQDNSEINGYHLKVLTNTQIELTKENDGQQQTIILMMFKPRT